MVATDYDADMIATAQRALARFGNRASAQRADAADLPFEAGRIAVLEAAPIRLLAVGHGDHIRMLRVGQLEAELAKLRVTDIRVRRAAGGLAARFAATKAA